jgi:hypothetical protein
MPREPLSHDQYLQKRRRFRRRQNCIRLGIIAVILLFLVVPRHGSHDSLSNALAWVLVAYCVVALTVEVVGATSYFSEKYRQGYKIGPYADIPRDKPESNQT